MNWLCILLEICFGGFVARLGSEDWRTRETANVVLVKALPFSVPAIIAGTDSEVPEARARCRRIMDRFRGQITVIVTDFEIWDAIASQNMFIDHEGNDALKEFSGFQVKRVCVLMGIAKESEREYWEDHPEAVYGWAVSTFAYEMQQRLRQKSLK